MISYNYRKHLRAVLLLQNWNNVGHFGIYKHNIQNYITRLYEYYISFGLPKNYRELFLDSAIKLEDKFQENGIIGYNSNVIFIFSMTIAIAEGIISKTSNAKAIGLWTEILDYCKDNLSINYLVYLEDLEVAATVAEIITETEM